MRSAKAVARRAGNALMGQVLRFADRARRNAATRRSTKPLAPSAYFCTRCEADRFLLYPGGMVQCAICGAQIDNLAVRPSSSDPGRP